MSYTMAPTCLRIGVRIAADGTEVNCSKHLKHNYKNFVDLHWLHLLAQDTFNELSLDFE